MCTTSSRACLGQSHNDCATSREGDARSQLRTWPVERLDHTARRDRRQDLLQSLFLPTPFEALGEPTTGGAAP